MTAPARAWHVVGRRGDGRTVVVDIDGAGTRHTERLVDDLAGEVRARSEGRWVFSDASRWYPALLEAGVTIARCRDLRLCHAVLRAVPDADADLVDATAWEAPADVDAGDTLFASEGGVPDRIDEVLAELERQQRAVLAADRPGALSLLLALESAGGLLAAELHAAGVPWDVDVHERLLVDMLGERPAYGGPPARLEALASRIRGILGDAELQLDSPARLLRALRRAGLDVASTSKWELGGIDHPVVAPLLEYKRLLRMLTANGWSWMREWVRAGRFRPVYVPGGVVTGRWASSGGGALQLPRSLRPAVRADPGWRLVVADVSQLEPRVLAAMAADSALADAARGRDLYQGIVARGVTATRDEAKSAMLGAMYGATTGESGRLVPVMRRAYPRAMGLVDAAAETGERGGVVRTALGRTSPPPGELWRRMQADASEDAAPDAHAQVAGRIARERGRFTRNFVVQGTAAEWALAWLAETRRLLAALPEVDLADAAHASGPVFARRAHLAFFLHDEIIVHAPAVQAERAAAIVAQAAQTATTTLFGDVPLDFPLDLRISDDAAKA